MYISRIDDDKKLIFLAETDRDEMICVKVMRQYSEEIHEKCASMGISPQVERF